MPLLIMPCVAALGAAQSSSDHTEGPAQVLKEPHFAPTRDGVKLKTTIFRLVSVNRGPVLLLRTPYNQQNNEAQARRFAESGYIAVTQDCRGRFGSEGGFVFYNGEGQDGYDAVEWIRAQPWCDGHVGMWGHSYLASVQWLTVGEGAPLDAMAPAAGAADFYRNQYLGGAYMLGMTRAGYSVGFYGPPPEVGRSPEWPRWFLHLPLADFETVTGYAAPWQTSFMLHNKHDGFWKRSDVTGDIPRINVPGLHMVGYFDFLCRAAVSGFQTMRARSATAFSRANQQLIIGPWDHGTGNRKTAEVDFGPQAQVDVINENRAWFDRFLKPHGGTMEPVPAVRYFSMGDNVWHTASQWPPAAAVETAFYLHSKGHAQTARGDGTVDSDRPGSSELADVFKADPADPVPNVPALGRKYTDTWGPTDQRLAGERADVLIFSTPPLVKPLTFAGPLRAELYVDADTPDADWVVRLIDVRPDGFAQPLATGIQRGSFRDSETNPTPLTPGKVYAINVDLGHAAARIEPGHALRVQVAPSCFPLFERNANTGEGPQGARSAVATEHVWHSRARPSRVWLPIMR
jgi:predicted acyl esterase